MNELKEIYEFLKDHIPLVVDMDSRDLVYDKRSMYYKIYKYIYDMNNKNK